MYPKASPIHLVGIILVLSGFLNSSCSKNTEEGWISIFDGKSFKGWQGDTEKYTIQNKAIICKEGEVGTIFTNETYSDFMVRFEFRLPVGGNNGLAIRYPGYGDPAYTGMCELQVLDNTSPDYADLDPRQFHGSVYGMVAAKRGFLNPIGEWNNEQVTVDGSHIKVILNGHVILDSDLSQVNEFMHDKPHPGRDLKSGYFGFAGHKDPVAFRHIFIKRISKSSES